MVFPPMIFALVLYCIGLAPGQLCEPHIAIDSVIARGDLARCDQFGLASYLDAGTGTRRVAVVHITCSETL